MAVGAILIILMVALTMALFAVIQHSLVLGLTMSGILLVSSVVGIILGAIMTAGVVFWIKKKRDGAIRMQGSKNLTLEGGNGASVSAYHVSNVVMKSAETVPCACHNAPQTTQQNTVPTTDAKHYTEMEDLQHKKDRFTNVAIAAPKTPSQLESYC